MNLIDKITYVEEILQTEALEDASENYDRIKEKLHAALMLDPDSIRALEARSGREYSLKYFAMFLAAENRDVEAFPLIINFFAAYDQAAWECLNEITTRDMGRILASVCTGNISALKNTVELPKMNSFARIACFDALGTLMREGIISRGDLIQCFRAWLEDDRLSLFEHSALAKTCVDLLLWEMQQELLVMLESERIDREEIRREEIEKNLPDSDFNDLMAHIFSLINNATKSIDELRMRGYKSALTAMYDDKTLSALSPMFAQNNEINGTITSPEFLHGFMLAILITPSRILPDEWLPALLDSVTLAPGMADDDINASLLELRDFYHHLNHDFLDGLLHCPFDQLAQIDAGLAPMAKVWCKGFHCGIALRKQYWIEHQINEEFKLAVSTIMMLSDEQFAIAILKQSGMKNNNVERNKLFQECLGNLCYAVNILIQHGVEYDAENNSDSSTLLSSEPVQKRKVGRNTPCPCGSGKKFKKCCGTSGRALH